MWGGYCTNLRIQSLTIFVKSSVLVIWLGPKYASVIPKYILRSNADLYNLIINDENRSLSFNPLRTKQIADEFLECV